MEPQNVRYHEVQLELFKNTCTNRHIVTCDFDITLIGET